MKRNPRRLNSFALYSSSLQDEKKIVVLLPKGFNPEVSYPLLIMHDGHNLFYKKDSAFGHTWKIKEAADGLEKELGYQIIIAGIYVKPEKRIGEYTPFVYDNDRKLAPDIRKIQKIAPRGDMYARWLVEDLLPFLKSEYPVDESGIFLAGSSLGANITLYAASRYPHIFAGIGLFSPAFWYSYTPLAEFVMKHHDPPLSVYMIVGGQEGFKKGNHVSTAYLEYVNKMDRLLHDYHKINYVYRIDNEGVHSEISWAHQFPAFLTWIFENVRK